MKAFDKANLEADLHNLIAPKGSEFQEGELYKDLYRNNVWVLDDKFMSYCTVLSEAEMSKVINVITDGEVKDPDDDRPDITLFFSADPTKGDRMLDVVVVELKRLGITPEQNSIVEFQLDTRTQRLADYYGRRIQRMFFRLLYSISTNIAKRSSNGISLNLGSLSWLRNASAIDVRRISINLSIVL